MSQQLKKGDRVFIRGWVMLKGLESGCSYDVDDIRDQYGKPTATFRRCTTGRVTCRHYLDNVTPWIRDPMSEDLNGILIERRKPEPVEPVATGLKMAVIDPNPVPGQIAANPFGMEES